MTINELIEDIKELCLAHEQVVSFYVGNTFDIATSKSSERYPAVWFELPILTDYTDRRRKSHSIALNFLTLAKEDDIDDQMSKTSDMETIADEVVQAIDDKFKNIGIENITGLSLRGFSDVDLVGIRLDFSLTIGRECDYKDSFNTVI
jgi:hypothetical protein